MGDPVDESSVFEMRCEYCLGSGEAYGEPCTHCDAQGYLLTELGKQMFATINRRTARVKAQQATWAAS